MRITSKGQVTIPLEIRERLGLLPNTEVEFVVRGDSVRIVKAKASRREDRGQMVVRRLRGSAKGATSFATFSLLHDGWPEHGSGLGQRARSDVGWPSPLYSSSCPPICTCRLGDLWIWCGTTTPITCAKARLRRCSGSRLL